MSNISTEQFKPLHLSTLQQRIVLADTQNVHCELGRANGKTTYIQGPRAVRMADDMAGSHIGLFASTYRSIFDNILPGLLEFFNTYYIRGVHFEVGKTPPKHFKQPFQPVFDWKHTISTVWGTVFKFISCDRPESSLGCSFAHLIGDEILRIPEDLFTERIAPTLRANPSLFGHSNFYMGLTTTSSSPNFDTDYDWWLKWENNMDKERLNEIMYVAKRIDEAKFTLLTTKNETTRKKAQWFVSHWSKWLATARQRQTMYVKASTFANIIAITPEYIENQFDLTKNFETFKLSILNIRPSKVKDMFFGRFSKKHIFNDSYVYGNLDIISASESSTKYSRDLKYCDSSRPLYGGFDPGSFMSLVIGQRKKTEFRTLKNFHKIDPEQHAEMAVAFADFFQYHKRKELFLHYDRAGNKRLDSEGSPDKTGDINDTDAKILKRELERYGWTVHLMSIGQRMIWHWEHHALLNLLFSEREANTDRIKICANECEELISSINMSPLRRTDGRITLDKSSEKNLPFEQQAFWSTQIATAFMYLLWGEYHKLMPKYKTEQVDYDTVIM